MAKKPNWPTNRLESLALQHELFTFPGFAGLRLFASFLKLDQGFRMKASHYRDFATVAIECFPEYLSVSKSYLGSYLLLYL